MGALSKVDQAEEGSPRDQSTDVTAQHIPSVDSNHVAIQALRKRRSELVDETEDHVDKINREISEMRREKRRLEQAVHVVLTRVSKKTHPNQSNGAADVTAQHNRTVDLNHPAIQALMKNIDEFADKCQDYSDKANREMSRMRRESREIEQAFLALYARMSKNIHSHQRNGDTSTTSDSARRGSRALPVIVKKNRSPRKPRGD